MYSLNKMVPLQQELRLPKVQRPVTQQKSPLFQNAQEEQIRYQELTARNQHHQRKVD
jgi:hypothetical protein